MSFSANPGVMFSDHNGRRKKSIERRQTRLAAKVPFLARFLDEGERVLLLSTGCSPMGMLEQLLTGWIVYYLKRCMFVFTEQRIFHIPTRSDYTFRNSIAETRYADCRSITVKGRTLIVEYLNGTTEKFPYLTKSDSKKIKNILKTVSFEGMPSESQRRTHLCPRCTKPLKRADYVCPSCFLEFKNESEAKRTSLLFPGGGYFYTRHPVLGVGDALTELILLVLVLGALIATVQDQEGAIISLAVVAVLLGIEKAISVYHSNHFIREFIPKPSRLTENGELSGGRRDLWLGVGAGCVALLLAATMVVGLVIDDPDLEILEAAQLGDSEAVQALLDSGANVEARDFEFEATPLMVAAGQGHLDIVRTLLGAGADVDASDKDGWTALMWAAQGDWVDVSRLLLTTGADVDTSAIDGTTALIWAAADGHIESVRLFVDAGADLTAQTNQGLTALRVAMERNHADVASLLLNADTAESDR